MTLDKCSKGVVCPPGRCKWKPVDKKSGKVLKCSACKRLTMEIFQRETPPGGGPHVANQRGESLC
jgi:hypothetical protein